MTQKKVNDMKRVIRTALQNYPSIEFKEDAEHLDVYQSGEKRISYAYNQALTQDLNQFNDPDFHFLYGYTETGFAGEFERVSAVFYHEKGKFIWSLYWSDNKLHTPLFEIYDGSIEPYLQTDVFDLKPVLQKKLKDIMMKHASFRVQALF